MHNRFFVNYTLHMELEAMKEGILLIIHQGWSNIDIETDCVLVVYEWRGLH